jgi:hypothetical protein
VQIRGKFRYLGPHDSSESRKACQQILDELAGEAYRQIVGKPPPRPRLLADDHRTVCLMMRRYNCIRHQFGTHSVINGVDIRTLLASAFSQAVTEP